MDSVDVTAAIERQPFAVTSNSQIYKFKDCQKALKFRGSQREFDLSLAAGDCSVRIYGRSMSRNVRGEISLDGFIMDLETPFEPKAVNESQRKILMDDMISVVLALHRKGIVHGDIKPKNMLLCSDGKLRLCDFAEGRRIEEDPNEWEGITTANYMAPTRCQNWRNAADPPPTIEDDLYSLGLSIWELYTGKVPFEDEYIDDILDTVKTGKTVDVDEVKEESVRETIRNFLRYGGAKV